MAQPLFQIVAAEKINALHQKCHVFMNVICLTMVHYSKQSRDGIETIELQIVHSSSASVVSRIGPFHF